MTRFAILAVCGGLSCMPAAAVSPNPQDLVIPASELLRAKGLIPRLGSEAFQEREAAEKELARMGRLARPVLREALQVNQDPEVRQRAARLLPKADAAELKARTEAFLADIEGQYEHDMPGWSEFRRTVRAEHELLGLKLGTDARLGRLSREMFVEMLKSRAATTILPLIDAGGEDLSKAASQHRLQIFLEMNPGVFGGVVNANQSPKQPSLVDFSALLLAEIRLEGKASPRVGQFFVSTSQLFHSPAINSALQGKGPHVEVFRRLLGAWFRNLTDVNELQQVAFQVTQFNIKEALPAMKRAVTGQGSPVHLRAQAIGAIAKLGGKDELPLLRKLLDEDTTIQANRFPNRMDLQIRDVALGMCVIVTGQDPKAYGYEINQLNDQIKFQYWTFAFRTKEKRDEALKKWSDWEKTHATKN